MYSSDEDDIWGDDLISDECLLQKLNEVQKVVKGFLDGLCIQGFNLNYV